MQKFVKFGKGIFYSKKTINSKIIMCKLGNYLNKRF